MLDGLRAAIDDLHVTVVTSSPPETYLPYGCDSVRFDDLAGLAAAVADTDAVLLGGGSIFFDYWACDASAVLTPRHQGRLAVDGARAAGRRRRQAGHDL